MNLFFTADEHYGHSNRNGGIIFMCNRPYANLEEMKEAFIANHNAKVPDKGDSLTVHLGDMFWRFLTTEECCEIMDRLNGKHAYIRGNHEEVFRVPDNLLLRWTKFSHYSINSANDLRFSSQEGPFGNYAGTRAASNKENNELFKMR